LVEIRDPDTAARREIETYVKEVEDYFGRTAESAGLAAPAELARRLRYLTMGVFIAIRLERSRAPIETARVSTIELLAHSFDTTPEDVERRVAHSRT
jgi:hypothetical protein